MNIPIIFEILIGLTFIYLILSLLASEIQELIATLLQWRATHLKKSIESLLAGEVDLNRDTEQLEKVRKISNLVYQNPLIKNLNYQAEGPLEKFFRSIVHGIAGIFQNSQSKNNIFGIESTAPSYIPAKTFAISIMDSLKINKLMETISLFRLQRFQERKLSEITYAVDSFTFDPVTKGKLDEELQSLKERLNLFASEYSQSKVSLETTVERMSNRFDIYVENVQTHLYEWENLGLFNRRLMSITDVFHNPSEKEVLFMELRPSFTNLLNLVRQLVKARETVDEIIVDPNNPIYKEIVDTINALPESLKHSLYLLASQAEFKTKSASEQLERFQREIETWFDNAMDRATGVYKRNAKGVAILLGLFIAVSLNADTLRIVDTLSKDVALRTAVNEYGQQLVNEKGGDKTLTPEDWQAVQQDIDTALKDINLPIGWNEKVSASVTNQEIPGLVGKKVLGWLISALAISMGAAFWFDVLGKFINVRNAGKKPQATNRDPRLDVNVEKQITE